MTSETQVPNHLDKEAIERGAEEIIDAVTDMNGFHSIVAAAACVIATFALSVEQGKGEEHLENMIREFSADVRQRFADCLDVGADLVEAAQ